jgi:hypothetical protein
MNSSVSFKNHELLLSFQVYLAMSWSMCAAVFIIIAPLVYEGIDIKNAIKQMKTVYPSNEHPSNGTKESCNGRLSTGEKPKNIKIGTPIKENFADPMFITQRSVTEEV